MRENRLYGSEGGEAKKPSLPLSDQAADGDPLGCFDALAMTVRALVYRPYFPKGHALGLQRTEPRDGETRLCCSRNRSAE